MLLCLRMSLKMYRKVPRCYVAKRRKIIIILKNPAEFYPAVLQPNTLKINK